MCFSGLISKAIAFTLHNFKTIAWNKQPRTISHEHGPNTVSREHGPVFFYIFTLFLFHNFVAWYVYCSSLLQKIPCSFIHPANEIQQWPCPVLTCNLGLFLINYFWRICCFYGRKLREKSMANKLGGSSDSFQRQVLQLLQSTSTFSVVLRQPFSLWSYATSTLAILLVLITIIDVTVPNNF